MKGIVLASAIAATLFVLGRLLVNQHEISALRYELARQTASGAEGLSAPGAAAAADADAAPVLFYSVRSSAAAAPPLSGPSLAGDTLPVQQPEGGQLLGQVDSVEAGRVVGWACQKGAAGRALSVVLYVDGTLAAQVQAALLPRPELVRLCQWEDAADAGVGVGFLVELPPLPAGEHELRAFLLDPSGAFKQELNQSPLHFRESVVQPDQEEQIRRKDSIIQIRNSQVAALWEELHMRQPWRNAISAHTPLVPFGEAEGDTPGSSQQRLLAVLAINTGPHAQDRRDVLRRTWVPGGAALKDLEEKEGLLIRFVIGRAERHDDPVEKELQEEMNRHGDVVRLDVVDRYSELSQKTLKLFSSLPRQIDADFYFKIDDDVAVNLDALAAYLRARRTQSNLYIGCMKSGEVLTDKRWKWYEPEHWRFGDPAGEGGCRINYPRHASGQIYGLSRPVARFIGQNEAVLHRYANEDVGVGSWLLGLDIQYDNQRRLCCDSEWRCKDQTTPQTVCLAFYEHQCAGICKSEKRLEGIYNDCVVDPYAASKMGKLPWWGDSGFYSAKSSLS